MLDFNLKRKYQINNTKLVVRELFCVFSVPYFHGRVRACDKATILEDSHCIHSTTTVRFQRPRPRRESSLVHNIYIPAFDRSIL
jgi:hypothetical protein